MLTLNPEPQDSNEFAPFMGDAIPMKVVAEISDEHCQVVLVMLSFLNRSSSSIWAISHRCIAIPIWGCHVRIRRAIPPILPSTADF